MQNEGSTKRLHRAEYLHRRVPGTRNDEVIKMFDVLVDWVLPRPGRCYLS